MSMPPHIRDIVADSVARAIGAKDAFGADWGLSYFERARCYAAADAVLAVIRERVEALRGRPGWCSEDGWDTVLDDVLALFKEEA